jgi:hypothetical protein
VTGRHPIANDLLLDDLRRVARAMNARAVTLAQYRRRGQFDFKTLMDHFGSWSRASRLAGLEVLRRPRTRWIPGDQLASDLQRVARALGQRGLSRSQYDAYGAFCSPTYINRFGSWSTALERAGLEPGQRHVMDEHSGSRSRASRLARLKVARRGKTPRISDDQLVSDLQCVARKLGQRTVKRPQYDAQGAYCSLTCINRFGSWSTALKLAGLEPGRRRWTVEEHFQSLQQAWLALGRQPLLREMQPPLSKFTKSAYLRRFGTWQKALAAFALWVRTETPAKSRQFQVSYRSPEDETLLDDLRRVAREMKTRAVTAQQYGKHGQFSIHVMQHRFGSWLQARQRAGLEGTTLKRIADEELLRDLRRVAGRRRGRTLTRGQYDARGAYTAATCFFRFGSWRAALERAGL